MNRTNSKNEEYFIEKYQTTVRKSAKVVISRCAKEWLL